MFKKILLGCFAFVIMFGLVGCNNNSNNNPPNNTLVICSELSLAIRQSWLEKNPGNDRTVDDLFIHHYFGTFDSASTIYVRVVGSGVGMAIWEETVAGITFSFPVWTPIEVWKDDNFYTLTEAYEKKILTIENLQTIHSRHRGGF